MSVVGKLAEGVSAYDAGRFNRAVARTNAANATRDGVMAEADIREGARAAMGGQVGAQAQSGFMPGEGSALDALRETAVKATTDILLTRRKTKAAVQGFDVQGRAAYAAGYNAMSGKFMEATTDAVKLLAGGGAG